MVPCIMCRAELTRTSSSRAALASDFVCILVDMLSHVFDKVRGKGERRISLVGR